MKTLTPLWFITGVLFGFALSPLSYIALELHGQRGQTPAVQPADPSLVTGLAELAADEHRLRVKVETTLDETRNQACEVIMKLIGEIERLRKRPSLQKGAYNAIEERS